MQTHTRKLLAEEFPQVRSLRTSDSMNEVLVAGHNVAGGSRLQPYRDAFSDWRDHMFWRRIAVRKL